MPKYVLAVLAAGCLWGTMGFFTRTLASGGIAAGLFTGVAAQYLVNRMDGENKGT